MVAEIFLVAADVTRGTLAIRESLVQATAASGALHDSLERACVRRQFREAALTAAHVSLRYAARLIAVASHFPHIGGIWKKGGGRRRV